MAGASASQVASFYRFVIEDVINSLRDAFLDEGVDEQVLQDIKATWSKKIEDSGVLSTNPLPNEISGNDSNVSVTNAAKAEKSNIASQKVIDKNKKNSTNNAQNNIETYTPTTSGTSVITSNPQHKKNGGVGAATTASGGSGGGTGSTTTNAGCKRSNPTVANKNINNNNNNTDNVDEVSGTPSKKSNIINSVPEIIPLPTTLPRVSVPTVMGMNTNLSKGVIPHTMTQNVVSQAPTTIVNPAIKSNIFRASTIVNTAAPNAVRQPFLQPTIMAPNGQRLMILNNNNQINQPQYIMSNNGPFMLGSMLNVPGGAPQLLANPTIIPQQGLAQGSFYTQMPGGIVQQMRPMQPTPANATPVQRNIASKKANQVDGVDDISSDDDVDDEEDFRDTFEDMDDDEILMNDEENPSVIEDEEPLNSGDDVSEEDSDIIFDTDNVIVCQYDKITRSRNRWKFQLKDGIMNIAGKDYIYHKAVGDAEW